MKTHYGQCDKANESHNTEYWSKSACGLDADIPMSEDIKYVTCKKCLAKFKKRIDYIKDKLGLHESTSFGGMGIGTF